MSKTIQLAPPAVDRPDGPFLDSGSPAIRTEAVYVVFTSIEDTLRAVRVASDFAKALDVPVTLVHFRTVPYVLAVDEPSGISPVETDAFKARLRAEDLDVRVRVCLCRDQRQAIGSAFAGHSLIVVAGRRHWWPTAAARQRRLLERAGHFVVFVDTSDESARASRVEPAPSRAVIDNKERAHA